MCVWPVESIIIGDGDHVTVPGVLAMSSAQSPRTHATGIRKQSKTAGKTAAHVHCTYDMVQGANFVFKRMPFSIKLCVDGSEKSVQFIKKARAQRPWIELEEPAQYSLAAPRWEDPRRPIKLQVIEMPRKYRVRVAAVDAQRCNIEDSKGYQS